MAQKNGLMVELMRILGDLIEVSEFKGLAEKLLEV